MHSGAAASIWRVAGVRGWAALLPALLLAYGVVGIEVLVHGRVWEATVLGSRLVEQWLRDSLLAMPLAIVAVCVGLWLVARGRAAGQADATGGALVIAGLFATFLAPLGVVGAGSAPQATVHGAPAVASTTSPLLHALFDGLIALLAGFPILALAWPLLHSHADNAEPARRLASRRQACARVVAVGGLVVPGVVAALALPVGTGAASGQTRTYYLAADEVAWDYAPSGENQISGEPFAEEAAEFVESGPDRIGSVYRKALYREYSDETFTARKPVAPEWQHLGALGPVIRAEVGDTIRVVFQNNTRFPASVHAHGVFYRKDAEGALYNDGTADADKADDAVAPGERYTYLWQVPERAGPGPSDSSSILWMYHSHSDEVPETNAGLIGPMIITARGAARPDGRPADVNREFVTLFNIYDENVSRYFDVNAATVTLPAPEDRHAVEEFKESNLKHSINGYLFGNLPGLTMRAGERVRWYVLAMGSEADLHTPHWHGQTLLWHGMRMDGVDLLPMSMKVLDMAPDSPGTWWFHCHVNDHLTAGMSALFTVEP